MKKIFALCATVALLSGAAMVSTTSVAHAQASGPFADVPTDHWAYQSVITLQNAGVVIGYPDQTYGGKRAMTRYEFAEAIARLLPLINKPGPDLSGYATKTDLSTLSTQLAASIQANQAALDALKALVAEFQPELQQLGVDVAAIKTRLTALEERVAVVEAEQKRVKINGDINIIGRSDVESSGHGLVDQDGYRLGTDKSIWANPQVYNDVLLSITGQVSDTATAVVKIDAGNYLQTIGNAESFDPASIRYSTFSGNGGYDATGSEQFDIFRAYLYAPVSLGAVGGAEAKVGRFGEQLTPYTFKAINPDSYASTPETSTGDVSVDGGSLGFSAGSVGITAFAGKEAPISNATLAAGLNGTTVRSGHFLPGSVVQGGVNTPANQFIDQAAGVRATYGTPDTYTIGITGLLARVTDTTGATLVDPQDAKAYNNLLVYGADYNGLIPGLEKTGLTFDGEVAVSSTGYNSKFSSDDSTKGNEAYKAELGYAANALTVKAGYQDVYANYAAPGSWGKIGDWVNPTNIRGGILSASYALSSSTKIVADGNLYQGQYNVGAASPLGKNDNLDSFDIGLKSALTSSYSLDLGYEYVYWKLKNAQDGIQNRNGQFITNGKPTEQYITIGIGHPINKNADVRVAYQIIDYKSDGTDFLGGNPANTGNAVGGVATTQFDFKF
jgi:hypothetical protein